MIATSASHIKQLRSTFDDKDIVEILRRDGVPIKDVAKAFELLDKHTTQPFSRKPTMEMPINPMSFGPPQEDSSQVEQLIEAVIDEKWKDIESNIEKVVQWKDRSEQRITQLEQQLSDITKQMDSLNKAIVGKVGEYDKNMSSVGSQLKAMEKAFSQFLPEFTQNMHELSRITQELKKK